MPLAVCACLLAQLCQIAIASSSCALMRATRYRSDGWAGICDVASAPGDGLLVATQSGVSRVMRSLLGASVVLPAWSMAGVAVDRKGVVYATDQHRNRLLRAGTGGRTTVVGTAGLLSAPAGIACGLQGDVFVANAGHNNVIRVLGGGASVFASGPLLSAPVGVAVNPGDGSLFISNLLSGTVVRVTADGAASSVVLAKLHRPWGLAFVDDTTLFVTISGAGELLRVSKRGATWDRAHTAMLATQLGEPRGVVATAHRGIFVADFAASSLFHLTPAPVRPAPTVVARIVNGGVLVRWTPPRSCARLFHVQPVQHGVRLPARTAIANHTYFRELAADQKYVFLVSQAGTEDGVSNEVYYAVAQPPPATSTKAPSPLVAKHVSPAPTRAVRLARTTKARGVAGLPLAAAHRPPPQPAKQVPTTAPKLPRSRIEQPHAFMLPAAALLLLVFLLVVGACDYYRQATKPPESDIDAILQSGLRTKKSLLVRTGRKTFSFVFEPFLVVISFLSRADSG